MTGRLLRGYVDGFVSLAMPGRYKSLSRDTWPSWPGAARDGVQRIMLSLRIKGDEYRYAPCCSREDGWPAPHATGMRVGDRMGNTKIFIR